MSEQKIIGFNEEVSYEEVLKFVGYDKAPQNWIKSTFGKCSFAMGRLFFIDAGSTEILYEFLPVSGLNNIWEESTYFLIYQY
jgi:ABC-type microcin C transport system permease subunit YejB